MAFPGGSRGQNRGKTFAPVGERTLVDGAAGKAHPKALRGGRARLGAVSASLNCRKRRGCALGRGSTLSVRLATDNPVRLVSWWNATSGRVELTLCVALILRRSQRAGGRAPPSPSDALVQILCSPVCASLKCGLSCSARSNCARALRRSGRPRRGLARASCAPARCPAAAGRVIRHKPIASR